MGILDKVKEVAGTAVEAGKKAADAAKEKVEDDADGRQTEHEMLVVQWQKGVKAVVWPPRAAEASTVIC